MALQQKFGWDEPRHRPAVFARTVVRAACAGVALFTAGVLAGRVVASISGLLFYAGLLLGAAGAASIVVADRRRIGIDEAGVSVAGFLGRLPARTLPLERIGRAEIVAFAEPFVLPKGFGPERKPSARRQLPTQPTLCLSSRKNRRLSVLPLGDDVDPRALLAFFRSRGIVAGFADSDEETRRKSAAVPVALCLLAGLLATAYWNGQRAKLPARRLSVPTIACVTLKGTDGIFVRVPGLGNLRTVSLISLGKDSRSIPVADVQVVRPSPTGPSAVDGVVAFRAGNVERKGLYVVSITNDGGGFTQAPFVAVADRPQGKGC